MQWRADRAFFLRGDHGASPRGQGGLSRDRGGVCRGGGGGGGVVRVA